MNRANQREAARESVRSAGAATVPPGGFEGPLAQQQGSLNRLGRKIRVLVVDDSVVIRRLITRTLSAEPSFDVVGHAANGLLALRRAAELKPDVITLDVEMPEMDGLAALQRLREASSQACIIMCSTLTSRGASATIDALMLGANDYVTKPSDVCTMDAALAMLRKELVSKIMQFFEHRKMRIAPPAPLPAAHAPLVLPAVAQVAPRERAAVKRNVVAIGVSTGGPTALMEILPQFPASFPMPVAIVQHMPAVFTRLLADRLQTQCGLEVLEATDGMPLRPGRAVLAPGDYHMRLERVGSEVVARLDQEPRENSCRPAVDVLFRSIADVYGGAAVGVILTGMGQDGLRGMAQLKNKGAYVIAQDQASSVVWGMPGAVVEAGLADAVVGLRGVVPEILRQVSQ